MEKNTVLLSLEDYNKLRDFESKIKQNKICVKWNNRGFGSTAYYTKDEVIKEISDNHERIVKENKKLIIENEKLQEKEFTGKPITTIEDVKQMSSREFRKWKKSI